MLLAIHLRFIARPFFLIVVAALLAGCATSQDPATRIDGINDPYEAQNRRIHEFNKGFDSNLLKPVSRGYAVIPVELRDRVNDFSYNLAEPGYAINSLLQADVRGVGVAVVRFGMNSTIGLLGFFDAATAFNIQRDETDFGETLAVWGVGEGAYVELPFFGPSTQRDAVGFFTDWFTNPLTFFTLSGPERLIPPTAYIGAVVNDRDKFSGTIDSILYESTDSYAQSRSIYLQNRRFRLGQGGTQDEDPYLDDIDPYAE